MIWLITNLVWLLITTDEGSDIFVLVLFRFRLELNIYIFYFRNLFFCYLALLFVVIIEEGLFVGTLFVMIDELVEYVARVYTKYILYRWTKTSPRGLMD